MTAYTHDWAHSVWHAHKTLLQIGVCLPLFSSTLPFNLNKPSHIITANSVYFHVHFPETLSAEEHPCFSIQEGKHWKRVFYWFWGEKVRATYRVLSFRSPLHLVGAITRSAVVTVWKHYQGQCSDWGNAPRAPNVGLWSQPDVSWEASSRIGEKETVTFEMLCVIWFHGLWPTITKYSQPYLPF